MFPEHAAMLRGLTCKELEARLVRHTKIRDGLGYSDPDYDVYISALEKITSSVCGVEIANLIGGPVAIHGGGIRLFGTDA